VPAAGRENRFVEWVCSAEGRLAGCPLVDPKRIFLFGFSDGATVAVELLSTRRFAGAVVASYGFTGTLPPKVQETKIGNWETRASGFITYNEEGNTMR
jgi:dienelactone hydrolase